MEYLHYLITAYETFHFRFGVVGRKYLLRPKTQKSSSDKYLLVGTYTSGKSEGILCL
jgi:hypothetical protein